MQLGVNIDSISVSNEPYFNDNVWYIGMPMTTAEQADFIGNYLGPEFHRQGLPTKILALDHNYELYNEALAIANDIRARRYVHGIAFHCYGGQPEMMQNVRNANKALPIYQTECTTLVDGNQWKRGFDHSLNDFVLQPGVRVDLVWNILLPPLNKRPKSFADICPECTGIIEVHPEGSIVLTSDYWVKAQVSRYVDSGAFEVDVTIPKDLELRGRAFVNLDGSRVVVLNNQKTTEASIVLRDNMGQIAVTIPARSAITVKWTPR
jgi:glucosylceramidase